MLLEPSSGQRKRDFPRQALAQEPPYFVTTSLLDFSGESVTSLQSPFISRTDKHLLSQQTTGPIAGQSIEGLKGEEA